MRIQRDWPLTKIVVLLSAGHQHSDASRCERLGLRWRLLKPPKRSELLEIIVAACGRGHDEKAATATLPALETKATRRLRVLLAEDSVVNQKLAVGLLTRMGHDVTLATNGRQAVDEASRRTFDLILMDVQMPELNGLQATAAIRADEQRSGGHVPIIAMTAHAMAGDRERCLAAGMDGYVSKPIRALTLFRTIEEVLQGISPRVEEEGMNKPAGYDWSTALEVVQGDEDLLRDLVDAFLGEYPRLVDEINRSVEQHDADQLRIAAHTLKGSLRYFGAEEASRLAYELEKKGKASSFEDVEELAGRLWQQLDRLMPPLVAFAKSGQLA